MPLRHIITFVVSLLAVVPGAIAESETAPPSAGEAAAPEAKPKRKPNPWPTPVLGPSRSGDPEVLFTFDDGPSPKNTEKVLDTLGEHKVKAIFFLVGRHLKGKEEESGRAAVRRMLAEGHAVGNHTVEHVHLCQGKTDRAAAQIDDNEKLVSTISGRPTGWFRAPYGDRCKRLLAQLAERGINHMHWDMDPQDWKHHNAAITKGYVIRRLRNLTGRAVLLMHDIHPETVKVLPEILDWIEAENARRVKRGSRPIRILDPAQVAAEQLAPDTLPFLADLAADLSGFAPSLVASLAGPLAPPRQVAHDGKVPPPTGGVTPASILPPLQAQP